MAWFEVHTENYMGGGGPLHYAETLRHDYPFSLHGVGLSLGSVDGLDRDHLTRVRATVERLQPGLVSEHLSWSVGDGSYLSDLLPLPLTEEALDLVCANVDEFQTFLGRRILIENPSTYLQFRHSTIPEWDFMAAVAARTGCGILCDVNNIYVSAQNHGWNPLAYLDTMPAAAVGEIHLAGHAIKTMENGATLRIDDHGSNVADPVWDLYREAITRLGPVPTLIERDNNIPPLADLVAEAHRADRVLAHAAQRDDAHAA